MEEEKVTTSGKVQETNENKDTKMSYDDLMNAARQLAQQNESLRNKINELIGELDQMGGAQARLHYLFKILENKFAFDPDYIIEVADEIKGLMTIKKEEPEKQENE